MALRPLRPDPRKDPTLSREVACFDSSEAEVVIGIDEVGRGAIAGPVAVGAHVVVRGTRTFPEGLRDSKLLSQVRREALAPEIARWGVGEVGYASAAEIDSQGITAMLGVAARRALLALHAAGVPVDRALILVDGAHDWLTPALRKPLRIETMVGADLACASVAAASVRAKVARDALMRVAHDEYSNYAWDRNKGYGAQAHYDGIAAYGLTQYHRVSWVQSAASSTRPPKEPR